MCAAVVREEVADVGGGDIGFIRERDQAVAHSISRHGWLDSRHLAANPATASEYGNAQNHGFNSYRARLRRRVTSLDSVHDPPRVPLLCPRTFPVLFVIPFPITLCLPFDVLSPARPRHLQPPASL